MYLCCSWFIDHVKCAYPQQCRKIDDKICYKDTVKKYTAWHRFTKETSGPFHCTNEMGSNPSRWHWSDESNAALRRLCSCDMGIIHIIWNMCCHPDWIRTGMTSRMCGGSRMLSGCAPSQQTLSIKLSRCSPVSPGEGLQIYKEDICPT